MAKKPVWINNKRYDSITEATEKFTRMLKDAESWQGDLIELVRGHEKIEEHEKRGLRVKGVSYEINYKYPGQKSCPFVYFNDYLVETVSLVKCIQGHQNPAMHKRRRRRDTEIEQYRQHIQDQIDSVERDSCQMCGKAQDLQIDHENPAFAVLVEDYKKSGSQSWPIFHKEKAKLRVLCGICHRKQAFLVPHTTLQAKRIRLQD